jgi:integrase
MKKPLPMTKRKSPQNPVPFVGVDGWLAASHYSADTRRAYLRGLVLFADSISARTYTPPDGKSPPYAEPTDWPLPVESIAPDMVREFLVYLSGYSRSGEAVYESGVKMFIEHLVTQGFDLDQRLFAAFVRKGRSKETDSAMAQKFAIQARELVVPAVLSLAMAKSPPIVGTNKGEARPNVRSVRRHLSALRDKALVLLLADTAVRVGEVRLIRTGQIKTARIASKDGVWAVDVEGKGSKVRTVYVSSPESQSAISAYIQAREAHAHGHGYSPHLFPNFGRGGSPLTTQHIAMVLAGLFQELVASNPDIADLAQEGFNLSPHDLRHWRAQELLRGGMTLEALQELLGHEDPATTRRIYAPLLGQQIVRQQIKPLVFNHAEGHQQGESYE